MNSPVKPCAPRAGGASWVRPAGAVLLEVVLALTLFAATATVVLGSLNASARAVRVMKTEAQAADLAVSLLSEIQIGLISAVDDGPRNYDDPFLAGWTWGVSVKPVDQETSDVRLHRVVVTVARNDFSYSLTQLMVVAPYEETLTGSPPQEGGNP